MEEKMWEVLNQLLDGQKRLENQVKENTLILKSLEHAAQVNKAEIDKISFEVAETKGEVKAIRRDLSAVETITAKNWQDIVHLKAIV